ncbi:MAG: hypothetical protein WCJ71_04645 [Candidatus Omnitrophota bacterium]
MKTNHIIAVFLIVLIFATLVGMLRQSDIYWLIYDCIVILFAFLGASALLKQK